jgi:hypothetical protein
VGNVGGQYDYWLLEGNECSAAPAARGFPSNPILSGSARTHVKKESMKRKIQGPYREIKYKEEIQGPYGKRKYKEENPGFLIFRPTDS